MLTHVVLLQLPPAGCSRPSLGSESAGMMRHSSSSIVDFHWLPVIEICIACSIWKTLGRPTATVAGANKPLPPVNITWPNICPPAHAPATKQPSFTHLSPRELWGHVSRKGADVQYRRRRWPRPYRAYSHAHHLICKCITSPILTV